MTQRNPMNDRYQTKDHQGQTRKSAASMKPKTKAASSVRIQDKKVKTKEQIKAEQKAEKAKKRELRAKYYNPDTPEYHRWRAVWIGCLVGSFAMLALGWFGTSFLPTAATYVSLGMAYILIFAAIFVDMSKIRKIRNEYAAKMEAGKSKEERAAEKKQKAEERKAKAAQASAPAPEPAPKKGLGRFLGSK